MKFYSRNTYETVKATTLKDKGEKNCPFCSQEDLCEYILWEGKHWKVAHNKYPLAGSKKGLLAIPHRCEKFTSNLSEDEWSEFKQVQIFMKDFYKDGKYFSFIREVGDIKSIHHLHYHFLPGEIYPEPLEKMLTEQGLNETIV